MNTNKWFEDVGKMLFHPIESTKNMSNYLRIVKLFGIKMTWNRDFWKFSCEVVSSNLETNFNHLLIVIELLWRKWIYGFFDEITGNAANGNLIDGKISLLLNSLISETRSVRWLSVHELEANAQVHLRLFIHIFI